MCKRNIATSVIISSYTVVNRQCQSCVCIHNIVVEKKKNVWSYKNFHKSRIRFTMYYYLLLQTAEETTCMYDFRRDARTGFYIRINGNKLFKQGWQVFHVSKKLKRYIIIPVVFVRTTVFNPFVDKTLSANLRRITAIFLVRRQKTKKTRRLNRIFQTLKYLPCLSFVLVRLKLYDAVD